MSKRKRRRGGRHPMPGAREPNGRLSRRVEHIRERDEMSTREAQSVVVAARMRHTGLPEDVVSINHVGRPNPGTLHGLMCLRGEISREQWDAAEWWIGKRAAYLRAIQARDQMTGAPPPGGSADEARYAEWCASITGLYDQIVACVQDASTLARMPLASALETILWRGHYVAHLSGDLRLALNAVHRRFLSPQRKAA